MRIRCCWLFWLFWLWLFWVLHFLVWAFPFLNDAKAMRLHVCCLLCPCNVHLLSCFSFSFYNFLSVIWETFFATMQMAAMVLERCLRFWFITVNGGASNPPFTFMPAQCLMDMLSQRLACALKPVIVDGKYDPFSSMHARIMLCKLLDVSDQKCMAIVISNRHRASDIPQNFIVSLALRLIDSDAKSI